MYPSTRHLRFLFTCLIGGAAMAAPYGVSGLLASPRAEDARRLAAEIVVMKADAEHLYNGKMSKPHQAGLRARLRGAMAIMPLLIRAARRDVPAWPAPDRDRIASLKQALAQGKAPEVLSGLAWLMKTYPFDATGLLPADQRPGAVKQAGNIHENYCAGCHDEPDLDVPRPAWSLIELGKKAPEVEIAARLVIGVRGENMTAMDNPLKDSEMSALIHYYRTHQPETDDE